MTSNSRIPWTRVLAEGAIIVVSILLAFGIDAAWDARNSREEEMVALSGLREDFVTNRAQMDRILERHRSRGAAFQWFEAASPEEMLTLSTDSASSVFRGLYLPDSFDAVRGNADALIGAGKLDLVRDDRLRERLVTFINLIDDAEEERAAMRAGGLEIFKATAEHDGPWGVGESLLPRIDSADLAALRRDERFVGLVRLGYHWSFVYAIQLQGVSDVVDDILELLGD